MSVITHSPSSSPAPDVKPGAGRGLGYVCAPSEPLGGKGFEFKRCVIRGEHEGMEGTVFLARPWRPEGTARFTDCRFDDSIDPRRFSGWKDTDKIEPEAQLSETGSMDLSGRRL